MNSDSYQPINCSVYDRFELLASRGTPVNLGYFESGELRYVDTVIRNFQTRNKVEYIMTDDFECRIDEVVRIDQSWLPNKYWNQAEKLKTLLTDIDDRLPVDHEWNWDQALKVEIAQFIGQVDVTSPTVKSYVEMTGYPYGWGGYGEYREVYRVNPEHYGSGEDERTIHMGIDLWLEAGTAVVAPLDGVVVGFADNQGVGNYGPTVLLQHEIGGSRFFSLYGHLGRSGLEKLKVGQQVRQGDWIGELGEWHENGNWPPHLHYQWITDLMGNTSDYRGVCSKRDWEFFQKICPCPTFFRKS